MISLFTDAGPDWASFILDLALAVIAAIGWTMNLKQRRKAAAAEAEAARYAKIAAESQQTIARLEEEKARREEKERRAKPWQVTHYKNDMYELINLTGDVAYDVRGYFHGRLMDQFPHNNDLNPLAGKTFVWGALGSTEVTFVWKASPDGDDQHFTLNMPAKY